MCAETETDNMAGHVYQLMGYDSDTKKVRDSKILLSNKLLFDVLLYHFYNVYCLTFEKSNSRSEWAC